jgi:rhodanese-related sulfurtransferase
MERAGAIHWHDLIAKWRYCQLRPAGSRGNNGHHVSIGSPAVSNAVTAIPAASPDAAARHFESQFAFETDCWDTHDAMRSPDPGFILLDVRSPALFEKGHVPGAISLPHGKIIASRMSEYLRSTLFVTYCAGPHCNGAARAAVRLARLGFAVKLMAGGITGWVEDGFALEAGPSPQ